ncbi:MAG: bifunctional riboflavin kinase/FAD synthetase [Bacteroidales bacterium]
MKLHTGKILQRLRNPVISIGIFDGVHKGHAAIFNRARQRAAELEGESVIVTFWPHPRLVLGSDTSQLKFLTTMDEKKMLIEKHEIDHLIILEFTREFSRLPACRFIKEYLVDGVGLKHLVFGYDHHFGHKREGNFENLKGCAAVYNFSLEQLEPVMEADHRISSSAIREALLTGNVRLAGDLLSYLYMIEGRIVGGKQVGRIIGFPTANIELFDSHKLIPADGVYAVEVVMGQRVYKGMMNIGFRPTISKGKEKTMETHIIDFEGDIYNQNISIRFVERIRNEQRFSSLDQLKEQIARDKVDALQILTR